MNACAITDHGNMFGVIEFYRTMKKNDIKPVIGCEVYVAPEGKTRFDKQGAYDGENDRKYNHLILLAKNQKGYENLMKIVSIGWTEGYYYKPRVDMEVLEKYHEGLIATSACLAGAIPQALLNESYDKAKEIALKHKNIFGDDYYLEVQDHNIREQKLVNPDIVRLGRELGIKVIATCDSHYLTKDDYEAHEVLLAIQTGSTMDDPNRFSFSQNEFYVKSEEEMLERFSWCKEAVYNTQEIVDKCDFEMKFGDIHLPDYDYPKDQYDSEDEYFRKLIGQGLIERYGNGKKENVPKEILKRASYEYSVIKNMHFIGYFNIVSDFIRWAKSQGIPVGTARGCTCEDTQILTTCGYKAISDVVVGDRVYSHTGRVKNVSETFRYDNNETLIKPCVYYGDKDGDYYTPDHKLLVLKASLEDNRSKIAQGYKFKETKYKEPKWTPVSEVKIGDMIAMPRVCYAGSEDFSKIEYGEQDEDYVYKRVYDIKYSNDYDYVYDITVDDDHSYVTSNFAAHNSAAGSIVAYATHITDIDPMKYDLLFERFLNPERISFPDIDVDFCYDRRGEVIDYVSKKYGKDHVSQIVTFGTMAARMAIRDVARAMGVPISTADKIAKSIPEEIGMTITKALELSEEFKGYYNQNETNKKLIDIALKIEGSPRHTSKHAAGVIIADNDISNYAPVMTADGEPVVQFPMTQIEDIGLIKMDFLGLRTLTVIKDTCDAVLKHKGIDVNLQNVVLHPEKYSEVYKMLQEGNTAGVFQFESSGMTELLGSMYNDIYELEFADDKEKEKYGEEYFNRLVAAVALYRPGPMDVRP